MQDNRPGPPAPRGMPKTRDSDADAVRYLVLRKLSAGMRHALVGELQAVQFATDLAAQLIKKGATGDRLNNAIGQIAEQTAAAADTSRSIIGWLRPEDGSDIEVDAAVQECLKLAGDVWILRGIRAKTSCRTGGATVAKTVLCELFVTSLLALTDMQPGALDIDVLAERVNGKVVVKLSACAAERLSAESPMPYRALNFTDVAVLAEAHKIPVSCKAATVTLEFQTSSA